MDAKFTFIGQLPKTVAESDIKNKLPHLIFEMQKQFTPSLKLEDIEIFEHAYTPAEPSCWIVQAGWKLK